MGKEKPEALFAMLNQIRRERDEFRDFTSRCQTMMDERDTLQNDLFGLMTEKAIQTAGDWQRQAINFPQKMNQFTLNDLNPDSGDSQVLKTDPMASAPVPVGKLDKSTRVPDPPVFTNGLDPTWDDCYSKIYHKLEANSDHYPTETARLAYVILRIGGDAAKHTMPRSLRGSLNPYTTSDQILDQLAEIYEGPSKDIHFVHRG